MSTAATAWFAWLRDEKRYPETTLAAYQHDLDQWTQHLEQLSCTYAQVTRHEFRDWLAAMAADGLSRQPSPDASLPSAVSIATAIATVISNVELTYMKPPKQHATIPKALAETDAADLITAINSLEGMNGSRRVILPCSACFTDAGCGYRKHLTCAAVMRHWGHGCGHR